MAPGSAGHQIPAEADDGSRVITLSYNHLMRESMTPSNMYF